jgi:hypothetical protein
MDIDINIVLCSAVGSITLCVCCAWCYVGYQNRREERRKAFEALQKDLQALEAKRGPADSTPLKSTSAEVVFV